MQNSCSLFFRGQLSHCSDSCMRPIVRVHSLAQQSKLFTLSAVWAFPQAWHGSPFPCRSATSHKAHPPWTDPGTAGRIAAPPPSEVPRPPFRHPCQCSRGEIWRWRWRCGTDGRPSPAGAGPAIARSPAVHSPPSSWKWTVCGEGLVSLVWKIIFKSTCVQCSFGLCCCQNVFWEQSLLVLC